MVPSIGELPIYGKWRIESSTNSKGYLVNTLFFYSKAYTLKSSRCVEPWMIFIFLICNKHIIAIW